MPGPLQTAGKVRVTSRRTTSMRTNGRITKMPKLKFYDVKARKSFTTDKFKKVTKSGRRFAVARAPSGIEAYRIIGKA